MAIWKKIVNWEKNGVVTENGCLGVVIILIYALNSKFYKMFAKSEHHPPSPDKYYLKKIMFIAAKHIFQFLFEKLWILLIFLLFCQILIHVMLCKNVFLLIIMTYILRFHRNYLKVYVWSQKRLELFTGLENTGRR